MLQEKERRLYGELDQWSGVSSFVALGGQIKKERNSKERKKKKERVSELNFGTRVPVDFGIRVREQWAAPVVCSRVSNTDGP